jgi:CcmD family protein
MKKFAIRLLFPILIILPFFVQAQQDAEMADTMRSEGKIYVLVAIVAVVLAGLVIYLVSIDRKISRLEKKLPGRQS